MAIIHVKSNSIADMTGTVTVHNSAGGTSTVAASDLVRPSDWNSAHNLFFTLGGNTTQQSTVSGTDIQIHGAGNISVGGSAGTLFISGPAWRTYDATQFGSFGPAAQSSSSLGQNSLYIVPHILRDYVSAGVLRMPVMITNSSSATSSGSRGVTINFAIYSRHSTNSTVLTLHYSTSYTAAASYSSNASMMQSYITAVGNSTSYNTASTSSAGVNISSLLHGARELVLPFSTMLSPGEWFYAVRVSTAGAGTPGNILAISHVGAAINSYNRMGIALNSSNPQHAKQIGFGVFSTTTGAIPNSVGIPDIHAHGFAPIIYWGTVTN